MSAVISAVSAMSALSAVSAVSAVSRPNSANGDSGGENDRKECFHGTKSIVAASSCALTHLAAMRVSNEHNFPLESTAETQP